MFGAALLFVTLSSLWARAAYRHRVVLLEPPAAESSVEVRARLRGELSAASFDVITLQVDSIADPKRMSETAASELQPAAVVFVVDPGPPDQVRQASIWLSDRLLRRTFVLTYTVDPADPGRDSARVAVQVAEILKADLAELSVTKPDRPKAPPPEPPPAPPPVEPPPPPERLGDGVRAEAGVALVQGFHGFGAALTPVARVGASLPSSWFRRAPLSLDLVLTAAALGSTARTEHEADSATVRQALGTFAVTARFAPTASVQPMLSVSSGAYRAEWSGEAEAPRVANEGRTWSGISGGGAGVWLQPTSGFALTLQGDVLSAWSRTILRFRGEEAASVGSPLLFVSLSAAGVF
jgi:hypothetical protein